MVASRTASVSIIAARPCISAAPCWTICADCIEPGTFGFAQVGQQAIAFAQRGVVTRGMAGTQGRAQVRAGPCTGAGRQPDQ